MSGFAIGLSTSSPQASVALFSKANELLWSRAVVAPNAASGALVHLLDDGLKAAGIKLEEVDRFAADLGPGSFTGVRVGIVFAKVLAMRRGLVAGASAFDLISVGRAAYVPSRRGEVFVREPGSAPYKAALPPSGSLGYEYGQEGVFPNAAHFAELFNSLEFMAPELLVPEYLTEPSISKPKQPYGGALA